MNTTPQQQPIRVLIGYDGSPCADAAINDLRRAGLPPAGEAVVMSVADVWPHLPGPPGGPPDAQALLRGSHPAGRSVTSQGNVGSNYSDIRGGEELNMSNVYNPETEVMAEIEWLELEARVVRRQVGQARSREDRRVLTRQLKELEEQVEVLRRRLPW
jgi:hypothetical protein